MSGDTVYQLTDAAISAVVANSGQLTTLTSQPWADFLTAVAKSPQQLTTKNLFTSEAAEPFCAMRLAWWANIPA